MYLKKQKNQHGFFNFYSYLLHFYNLSTWTLFCVKGLTNRINLIFRRLPSFPTLFVNPSLPTTCNASCCCSVPQSSLTLCDSIDCSTPGFPVIHHFLELAETHVHWVGDAIQPSHPLLSTSSPAFNLSQHQGLFQWVSSLHQVAFQPDLCKLPQSLYRIDSFWNLCHKHTVDYRDKYNYALFSFKWK